MEYKVAVAAMSALVVIVIISSITIPGMMESKAGYATNQMNYGSGVKVDYGDTKAGKATDALQIADIQSMIVMNAVLSLEKEQKVKGYRTTTLLLESVDTNAKSCTIKANDEETIILNEGDSASVGKGFTTLQLVKVVSEQGIQASYELPACILRVYDTYKK